ncbi:MAG: CapA family protein [Agathobacter sp.]|nr:CapA family protein [Agathobacter sp.]
MGTLREKRRRNRQRKLMMQLGVGGGIAGVVLIALVIGINGLNPKPTEGDATKVVTQTQTETEIVTELVEEELDTMQIVMVGDMLMHDKIIKSGLQEDGTYNFDHLFVNVKDTIEAADLAIVNQETIMGGSSFGYTGYPSFNSPSELAHAEVNAGFDLLLLATNHALDKGGTGVENCMTYLDENLPELDYVGINHSQEEQDENIYTYEANGITVAVLNYTYGTNGIPHPSGKPYLVNLLKEDKVRSDIQKAEEIADFTIVCPHWGTEYNLGTDSTQERWVQIFLEEGADLVLGAHPHVIEPIEWVSDEEGNQMLVYYSLGNFVNGTSSTGHGVTNRMVGGIADVTIGRNEETGEVEIIEYGAIPIVCHMSTGTEYTTYYMEDYTEEMASENLILNQDGEFSKALCESIVTQVWGE